MNEREQQLEQVALYALGVLSAPEATAVARLIHDDPAMRAEYNELRETVDAVALVAEEPVDSARSARMRERLMAKARADVASLRAARPQSPSFAAAWWGLGLVAAASIVFAVTSIVQDVSLRSDLAASQQRAANLQTQLAQTERVSARDRQTLTDLLAPDARRYDVAAGTVIERGHRLYFALTKLPPLPRGKVYQAWTAAKGSSSMAPSVTFTPNAQGVAVVALPSDAARIGTVAVTVEPDGGSKAPTSAPIFVRPLS